MNIFPLVAKTPFGVRTVSRREFLTNSGMGLGSLALGSLLAGRGVTSAAGISDSRVGQPHFAPKAKSVIFCFMVGGVSHMESFDPKPMLTKYAGKTISDTPFAQGINENSALNNLDRGIGRKIFQEIYPLQTGYKKYGQCGAEISDWFPHIGSCADDIAIVRSMWTTDNNHQAQYQFLTGRNIAEGNFPSLGAWVHYGLGSLNDNLPQFIVFGEPLGTCCGTVMGHGADYLGPQHGGILLDTSSGEALPFATPQVAVTRREQRAAFDLMKALNQDSLERYPDDPATEARIKSYELAFRMQTAVPEMVDTKNESDETKTLYGLDRLNGNDARFAEHCLLARKFVEGGTRFIQIHSGAGGAGAWDAHSQLKENHGSMANQVDQPLAGLIKDLKQRGLLETTLIVFATEFGRTPGLEGAEFGANNREGRDHHPFGFSVWMAGGGIKGGVVHGATDELGFHAVENRHYVTDIHATILTQLGLDPKRMELPGHKRIEKDFGHAITEIIA